jgi:hypothetical protein
MTRNYKRKFLFSLIITSIITFFLLQLFFGEDGIRKNRYIQRDILSIEDIIDEKKEEIKALEEKADTINTTTHILTVMNKVGYAPPSAKQYIFPYEKPPNEPRSAPLPQKKAIKTLTPLISFYISFGFSLLLHTLLWSMIHIYKKHKK